MTVEDIMTTQVMSIAPETLISEASDILHGHNFSALPVVSGDKTVLGMVSERELFSQDYKVHLPTYLYVLKQTDFVMGGKKELPYEAGRLARITAGEIMSKQASFVPPNMELGKLAAKFVAETADVFPVVDNSNALLGIVSRADLLKQYASPDLLLSYASSQASAPKSSSRYVDNEFGFVEKDFRSHFAFVTKARANIWLTTATILFIIGFLAGIIYVVNPNIFRPQQSGTSQDAPPPF